MEHNVASPPHLHAISPHPLVQPCCIIEGLRLPQLQSQLSAFHRHILTRTITISWHLLSSQKPKLLITMRIWLRTYDSTTSFSSSTSNTTPATLTPLPSRQQTLPTTEIYGVAGASSYRIVRSAGTSAFVQQSVCHDEGYYGGRCVDALIGWSEHLLGRQRHPRTHARHEPNAMP